MAIECKICGSIDNKAIGKPVINQTFPRATANNYQILQCRDCKYYFVAPDIDLSQEEWRSLYENEYFAGANLTSWQIRLRDKERKMRLKYIQSKLKIEKGKFLDMGCGEGFVLNEAYKNGFEPIGVDIAYNLSTENSAFSFHKRNVFEASFPDNYFSAIYMDSVLEHLLNPMETLRELRRILKPGGVFFVVVPNEDSLDNFMIKIMRILALQSDKYGKIKPFVTPYHVHGFNLNSLKAALSICKFTEIEIETFGGAYAYWRAYKFGTQVYFQNLLTYPVGLISKILNRQPQLMSFSLK
ncbi:MAG TPA: class I SAM-dependent methyltransferase [Ignavibacteria bacterium]